MSAKAVELVHLDGKKEIKANKEVLENILLDPAIKDKPVCVVSITGTFNQGKSFLLNFLLRYLELKYKEKKSLPVKWLNRKSDDRISGFNWKSGKQRNTIGILMWSEIFIAELPSKEEIAIILLDTQGIFDNKTTTLHCAAIFAISTLISSVQIYNLKSQIDQSALEHLERFSGYGQLAYGENSKAPFQEICFLIRDWQWPDDNPFGARGGQAYLKGFLKTRGQPENIKKQNENIEKLFENKKCFLLPYPGKKVAVEQAFKGDLQDIDEKFIDYVEEFAPFLLSNENLVPKKMNDTRVTVGDLVHLVQKYCDYFMKEDVPELKSMYLATSEAHHSAISEQISTNYRKWMGELIDQSSLPENVINQNHEIKKIELLEIFEKTKIMGPSKMKQEYKTKLSDKLDEHFSQFKNRNFVKLQKDMNTKKANEAMEKANEQLAQMKEIDKAQKKRLEDGKKIQKEIKDDINKLQRNVGEMNAGPLQRLGTEVGKTIGNAVVSKMDPEKVAKTIHIGIIIFMVVFVAVILKIIF